MKIRRLIIERFRGIDKLELVPGDRTVILGPNNSGKSTVLEALDLLLHTGIGRPRPDPTDVDYFGRDPDKLFAVEAVLGELPPTFRSGIVDHLEGWRSSSSECVAEPDGEGVEPAVRVRVVGSKDLEFLHEFAKPESAGARFGASHRREVGWFFDGRTRDPARQLAFYQGGALDRLFRSLDMTAAEQQLRDALQGGARLVNTTEAVARMLGSLGDDLRDVGLVRDGENPSFEAGRRSSRELLQALRLALPINESLSIPVDRQGRGAQRLLLVKILLRLEQARGGAVIGGFEEPEEALEPLRQGQMGATIRAIADSGGQVLVVTHSPEIVRAFELDDVVLMQERRQGHGTKPLRTALSPQAKAGYERNLDGPIVRALFARAALLVEGPSDVAILSVFWRRLVEVGTLKKPLEQLGLEIVNCEGAPKQAQIARVLHEAGKKVVPLVERDDAGEKSLAKLHAGDNWAALVLHESSPGGLTLEGALTRESTLTGLVAGLEAVRSDRGYVWEELRERLVSSADMVGGDVREGLKAATSASQFFSGLQESDARVIACRAISASDTHPAQIKGYRAARLFAEALVQDGGVPDNFNRALIELEQWLSGGCQGRPTIQMDHRDPPPRS